MNAEIIWLGAVASLAADAYLSVGAGIRNADHGADLGVSTIALDPQVEIYIDRTNAISCRSSDIGFRVEIHRSGGDRQGGQCTDRKSGGTSHKRFDHWG